jgi:hypothetical protein
MEFIQGCTFFKDKGNSEIFLAIVNVERVIAGYKLM